MGAVIHRRQPVRRGPIAICSASVDGGLWETRVYSEIPSTGI